MPSDAELNCRKVPCPMEACLAGVGEPCKNPSGKTKEIVHFPRREAAVAAGFHTL